VLAVTFAELARAAGVRAMSTTTIAAAAEAALERHSSRQ
jgi:hypothetical protein